MPVRDAGVELAYGTGWRLAVREFRKALWVMCVLSEGFCGFRLERDTCLQRGVLVSRGRRM